MTTGLRAAVDALRAGALVAFPTETVYGLGADATNPDALALLYRVKGRPADHPVIAHLGRDAALDRWGSDVSDLAHRLADAFWPGPLTLVVHRREGGIADAVTGGRPTVGLRVPDHTMALDLLDAFGAPIAAPSANRFGRVSPTTAQHVRADLGTDVGVVLDGGPCTVGVESTIVDCTANRPAVLRLGGISAAAIESVVGEPVPRRIAGEVAAPGTLAQHYAPNARVILVTAETLPDAVGRATLEGPVAILALKSTIADAPQSLRTLDSPTTVEEFARVLYQRLRDADEAGVRTLLVIPPPDEGLGAAVGDRLRRAASTVRP